MPLPANRSYEDTVDDDFGWPVPLAVPPRPVRARPPRRRSRPTPWPAVLAILGVALALAAGVWYARLDRSGPPRTVAVPRVVGMQETAAVNRLRRLGFGVRAVLRSGNARPGHVFAQRPSPQTTLERGTTVTIDVANGK
jgi:hypothetical protein